MQLPPTHRFRLHHAALTGEPLLTLQDNNNEGGDNDSRDPCCSASYREISTVDLREKVREEDRNISGVVEKK